MKRQRVVAAPAMPSPVVQELRTDFAAKAFFERCVLPRAPAVLRGPTCALLGRKLEADALSLARLTSLCGSTHVWVESAALAGGDRAGFGTGKKVLQTMSAFSRSLNRGSPVYLTTQRLPEDDTSGVSRVLSGSPAAELLAAGVIPVRPRIAGRLLPAAITVWVGYAREGASSNLHHDFHDNLYLLLRGRKRFTLFPPAAWPALAPVGDLVRVHASGVMNYAGAATRDDGAPPHLVLKWLRGPGHGSPAQLAVAEAELARAARDDPAYALAVGAHGAIDVDDADDDDDDDGAADEVDGMWAAAAKDARAPAARAAAAAATGSDSDSDVSSVSGASAAASALPDHFSRISLPSLRAALPAAKAPGDSRTEMDRMRALPAARAASPAFCSATTAPCVTVDLRAGEALWLPAGWAHEVVSFSDDSEDSHCAVNWWFYPAAEKSTAEQPYADGFWQSVFDAQMREQRLSPPSQPARVSAALAKTRVLKKKATGGSKKGR